MTRIFAVANQKGGVGKTTTAVNVAACLAEAGQRVLLVDCDPQANATSGIGGPATADAPTLYDVLIDGMALDQVATATAIPGLDLVPGDRDLSGAVLELAGLADRDHRLAAALAPARARYAWIFLDCPPSLGLLTVNALVAADAVIVPVQAEYYALEGLAQLIESIELVREHLNPRLRVAGMLLTMLDGRTRLAAEVADEVRRTFPELAYRTVIPRNVRLSEAPSHGLPITRYDPRSSGADAYFELAAEVAERG
jgi:chromosome partitioning protein